MGGFREGEEISVDRCSVGAQGRGSVCAPKVFNLGIVQGVLQFTIRAKLGSTDAPNIGFTEKRSPCLSVCVVRFFFSSNLDILKCSWGALQLLQRRFS